MLLLVLQSTCIKRNLYNVLPGYNVFFFAVWDSIMRIVKFGCGIHNR